MLALRLLFCIVTFTVGASALAILNAGVERDLSSGGSGGIAHRRHAANVVHNARDQAPDNVLAARNLRAQRRSLRQKRCAPRVHGEEENSSETTSTSSTQVTDVPANVAPAPTPTPSEDTTPTTTTAPAAETPDTPPAASNNNNNNSNSGGDTFTGQLTYYDVGLGACGNTNNNGEMVAAASQLLYDGFDGYTGANPNANPICGKQAVIHFEGKEITVTIVDRCVGCAKYDLDLSPTAFQQVADMGRGRLDGATWHFL